MMFLFLDGWYCLYWIAVNWRENSCREAWVVVIKLLLSCFELLPGEVGSLMMSWLGD
jgi:hypothetical protein